jgi:hypothetical protein
MAENTPKGVTLSIKENLCISFKFTPYALGSKKTLPPGMYEFTFKADFSLIEVEKIARVILTANLYEKSEPRQEIAELIALNTYSILDFDTVIIKDNINNQVLIPDVLIGSCNNLTLGSVRGMYAVKLEGSIYSNIPVPLINPKSLLPNLPTR